MRKVCTACGIEKPYSEFHKARKYIGGVNSVCKSCRAIYSRKRYEKNRVQMLEIIHQWRHNPDNKEKQRQQTRNSRARRGEQVKEWQHAYYAKNPERYRKATREWAKRNPEKVRERNKRQRSIRRGASMGDFTNDQWAQLKKEFDNRCAYCGKRAILTQDHVIPLSQGGAHTFTNIVPACQSCNSKKSGRSPVQAGMKIRS